MLESEIYQEGLIGDLNTNPNANPECRSVACRSLINIRNEIDPKMLSCGTPNVMALLGAITTNELKLSIVLFGRAVFASSANMSAL